MPHAVEPGITNSHRTWPTITNEEYRMTLFMRSMAR
jgi:hypothetical protein